MLANPNPNPNPNPNSNPNPTPTPNPTPDPKQEASTKGAADPKGPPVEGGAGRGSPGVVEEVVKVSKELMRQASETLGKVPVAP